MTDADTLRRLLEYREADRKELATALHDEAAQTLANVALHLQICERAIAVDVERGRAELAEARAALSGAINRLRRQVFALRPTTIEESGLGATLKRQVSMLAPREGLTIEVDDKLDRRLEPDVELGLYRIAQAAIDDAVARPGVSRVDVALAREGSRVRLTVADDAGGGAARSAPASDFEPVRDWLVVLGGELSGADGRGLSVSIPI